MLGGAVLILQIVLVIFGIKWIIDGIRSLNKHAKSNEAAQKRSNGLLVLLLGIAVIGFAVLGIPLLFGQPDIFWRR